MRACVRACVFIHVCRGGGGVIQMPLCASSEDLSKANECMTQLHVCASLHYSTYSM